MTQDTLIPLTYNSQITTSLGRLLPYEMAFNQNSQKLIMFTANSSKNTQSYCQPTKESICYNLPLHTHNEDHLQHPKISNLASGTHSEWILNRDKRRIYQKVTKKLLQKQNINSQINYRFTPATTKGPYQIIDKPTDVTYKLTDSDKKKLFNTETLFYLNHGKSTLFANFLNYTPLQD